MLYIVLILVLGALGLLVTALITANSLWAWVSIALSVLAALLLVADFARRRAARRRAARAVATKVDAEVVEEPVERTEPAKPSDEPEPVPAAVDDENGEPAVEATSTVDAEQVAKLDAEVVVVDEHPRYHVLGCPWLGTRDTIPIAVKEARDLGFTPCARCTPDAKLLTAAKS
ncbi:hypothetical protein [Amycolatopsis sp. GM8]|uniref:hypothetical protein n=1 Tax=Amycolatopsis sp. GM8 TaxID=2896530 RepID=UPI001F2F0BB5|nr:hypothetical protein [Amycolatopsis sp. GM8]